MSTPQKTDSVRGRENRLRVFMATVALGILLAGANRSHATPTCSDLDEMLPGDVLWMGFDGSATVKFNHSPTDRYCVNPISRSHLLAGHRWYNVRKIDDNAQRQVVLADLDGPYLLTTNLDTGGPRVLSGREPGTDVLVGDGPEFTDGIADMQFGPQGFVYVLSNRTPDGGTHSIMRIDPATGNRAIVTSIPADFDAQSSFSFLPNGDALVALNSLTNDPNPANRERQSHLVTVDLATGAIDEFMDPGERFPFPIFDVTVDSRGQAFILDDSKSILQIDFAAGWANPAAQLPVGFFGAYEIDAAPDGRLFALSQDRIAALSFTSNGGYAWSDITDVSMWSRRPYTMTVIGIPEPSSLGLVLVAIVAITGFRNTIRRNGGSTTARLHSTT